MSKTDNAAQIDQSLDTESSAYRQLPRAVVLPENEDEVAAVLKTWIVVDGSVSLIIVVVAAPPTRIV